jgi:septum formation protein
MLREKLSNYNLILASGSPRRQHFFKELDVPFTIVIKEVNEIYPDHLKGVQITDYLADLKSKRFNNLQTNDLLITSDTIVWFEEKALGKPKNKEDAFNMLKKMSGKQHAVYTSISIKSSFFQKIFHDETIVEFEEFTDEEINYYIKTYQPFDKAGSYGIQEWLGHVGVCKIEGSFFNVMGLPTHLVYKTLLNIAEK